MHLLDKGTSTPDCRSTITLTDICPLSSQDMEARLGNKRPGRTGDLRQDPLALHHRRRHLAVATMTILVTVVTLWRYDMINLPRARHVWCGKTSV